MIPIKPFITLPSSFTHKLRMRYLRHITLTSLASTSGAFPLHLKARTSSSRMFSTETEEEDDILAMFSTKYHAPVMWKECVDALLSCRRREVEGSQSPLLFVDGTLGGGGHTEALLKRLSPGDVVFGCDVDPTALETASKRLASYCQAHPERPLFIPVRSNFCDLATKLPDTKHPVTQDRIIESGVDGILLDLGVSSYQIDTAERGFAFMKDGPLDMRMGQQGGITAADVCNMFDEEEIQRILKTYGDEPRARIIARSIVERRPLQTTFDLMEAVAAVTPTFAKKGRRMGRTATLARVFQSLRIVVNQEDTVLEKALTKMAPSLLRPGGRLVVLSYHSMEDRATKRVMRDGVVSLDQVNNVKDVYGNYVGTPRPFRALGKPIKASEEEVGLNPRSRSATLRVAERQET